MKKPRLKIKGAVILYSDGFAEIDISRPAECEDCGACLSPEEKTIRLPSERILHEGDTVNVSIECGVITRMSFLLYFLPAIAALAGFAAGYFLAGDPGGLIGAFVFLAAGYALIKRFSSEKYRHSLILESQETE